MNQYSFLGKSRGVERVWSGLRGNLFESSGFRKVGGTGGKDLLRKTGRCTVICLPFLPNFARELELYLPQ
jgi:hypothetical protein